MNDPNGLWFEGGRLHVTYQLNPVEPRWGVMHWGHAVSDDLVTWSHLPIALSPVAGAPDADGCWSGCAVDAGAGPAIVYSGVRLEDGLRRQSICRADRAPGDDRWAAHAGNPIIGAPPPGIDPELFRDPFVWRDDGHWRMLVGGGTTGGHGCVLLYESRDFDSWRFAGTVLASDELDPAADADGPMWECPQLLRFGDRDVLIVSVVDRTPGIRPSHVIGIVGRLEAGRFAVDHVQHVGMGPDFYAPATTRMPDGRWLILGWIPEDPPAVDSDRTWAGALTFPRIVTLRPDGTVGLALAHEVAALRGPGVRAGHHDLLRDEPGVRVPLPAPPVEVDVAIQPGGARQVTVMLVDGDPADPAARLAYAPEERRLVIARRGIVSVAGRSSTAATDLPVEDGARLRLRAFLDGSILELEVNGHVMATLRQSTRSGPLNLVIAAEGGDGARASVELYPLEAPRQAPAGLRRALRPVRPSSARPSAPPDDRAGGA